MIGRAVACLDGPVIHPWFAVQVRSRHEKSVAGILSEKGLDCFLPLCRGRRQWSDRSLEQDARSDDSVPFVPNTAVVAISQSGETADT